MARKGDERKTLTFSALWNVQSYLKVLEQSKLYIYMHANLQNNDIDDGGAQEKSTA
jgi:hypothetical protein